MPNLLKCKFRIKNKNLFTIEKRLIFEDFDKPDSPEPTTQPVEEKKESKIELPDTPEARAIAEKLELERAEAEKKHQEKKAEIIASTRGEQPKTAEDKLEIPPEIKGFKIDPEKAKKGTDGSIEQEFKFGETNLEGKITFPKLPLDNTKPVQIIYNFVDNHGQVNQPKVWEDLRKKQQELGNFVLVTVNTPDSGNIKVEQQDVNLLKKMTEEIEQIQKTKAANIISFGSGKKSLKVQELMNDFHKLEPRLTHFLPIDKPEDYLKSLEENVFKKEKQHPAEGAGLTVSADIIPDEKRSPSGGGSFSGGAGSGASRPKDNSENATSSGATNTQDKPDLSPDSSKQEKNPSNITLDKLKEAGKKGPIKGNLGLFGDSILNSVHIKDIVSTPYKKAEHSKTSGWLLEQLKSIPDAELKKLDKVTILIGTNDIGATGENYTAEAIWKRIHAIHQFFLDKNITVYACTIPPFKGHNIGRYRSDFEETEKKRTEINDLIMQDPNIKKIPLHLTENEGGVASDVDSQQISENYHKNDWAHPDSEKLTNLITNYLKLDEEEQASEKPKSAISYPSVKSGESPEPIGKIKYTPEMGKYASDVLLPQFLAKGAKPGDSMPVTLPDGQEVTAKFAIHDLQAATGKRGRFEAVEIHPPQKNA